MNDEEDIERKLQESRYEIVQRLQLDRTSLLDYLRSKGTFDAGDCDLVLSEKTREQKAGKLLDILESKGKDGFVCFVDALQLLNPSLYEKITGKKANPGQIWEDMRDRFALGDCGYIPDVEILSSQLKRTIGDLHDLALRYQQVLKENQNLGVKLGRASTDLEAKHRKVEILEKQMVDTDHGVKEAHNNAKKLSDAVLQQLRSLQQGICERNTYIIALQMKLLAAEEEAKETRNVREDLRSQHDGLLNKLKELSRNYDLERRESLKLSEKLKTQKGSLQKACEFEKRCRELQFINEQFLGERDDTVWQLNELKDWTEALKARFDLVTDENKQLQQSFSSVTADNCKLKEEIEEVKLSLSLSRIGVTDLKGWNEELEERITEYREQRNFFSEARKEAIMERDQARQERDESIQKYNEVIQNRDENITKQAELGKHFEEKYEKAVVELRTLQTKLVDTEHEMEILRMTKLQAERNHTDQNEPNNTGEMHIDDLRNDDNENDIDGLVSTSASTSPQTFPPSSNSEVGFSWKGRRETTTIIDSVRRRVAGTLSLDRKLDQFTEQDKLSVQAKKCLGLQADKLIFKAPPSYNTLHCMFGLSLGRDIMGIPDLLTLESAMGSSGKGSDTSTASSSVTSETWREEAESPCDAGTLDADEDKEEDWGREYDAVSCINDGKDAIQQRRTRFKKLPPYKKSHSEPTLKVNVKESDVKSATEGKRKYKDPKIKKLLTRGESRCEELEDVDGSFQWVKEEECDHSAESTNQLESSTEISTSSGYSTLENHSGSANSSTEISSKDGKEVRSREEVEEFFNNLYHRKPFRQRAWAMKKKKGRSSSDPMITVHLEKSETNTNAQ